MAAQDPTPYDLQAVDQKHYDIQVRKERHSHKLQAKEVIYEVQFYNMRANQRLVDVRDQLRSMLKDLVQRAREGLADHDWGRVFINQRNLWQLLIVAPRRLGEFDTEVIMRDESIALDDSFEVHIGMIRSPNMGV